MKISSRIKKRRRLVALIILFLVIAIICFLIFQKKDYSILYNVDEFEVIEKYFKEDNYYSFEIKKGNNQYFTVINNQYFSSKKIIYNINTVTIDNTSCITISSTKARFSPLCVQDEEQISYHLVSGEMKEKLGLEQILNKADVIDSYKNINVYNYLNANYYIWNYRGFYRINDSKKEEISLFSKDIYHPSLISQVGNFLLIPDYESNYFFNKVYILNMITGKYETWSLNENIYFDSVVLGVYNKELYLVDKHEKIEWKINIEKKKLEKVGTENKGGMIYNHGWENISMNKLLYQSNLFKGVNIYDFQIQNKKLYTVIDENKIRIRERSPDKIISFHDGYVYYLEGNKLYAYSDANNEILLLDNFEWNFNSDNVIFILN